MSFLIFYGFKRKNFNFFFILMKFIHYPVAVNIKLILVINFKMEFIHFIYPQAFIFLLLI